jgi:hypothetical protein
MSEDVPRLTHMLRSFVTQDTFDKMKILHKVYPSIEAKRKSSEKEKQERSSLTWEYVRTLVKGL